MPADILTPTEVQHRLALMGQLLTAMETGALPMHAEDYRVTAESALAELRQLPAPSLATALAGLPASLSELVRRTQVELDVFKSTPDVETAFCACAELLQRLLRSSVRGPSAA
jgi:hypothetical protein